MAKTSEKKTKKEAVETPAKTSGRLGRILFLILCVVLLIAAAAAVQFVRYQRQMAASNTALTQQLQENQQTLQTMQSHWQAAAGELEQQKAVISDNQVGLQHLFQSKTRTNKEWVLAEALYYAKLAHLQAMINRDANVPIRLLSEADSEIRQLGDPSLIPVRKALAHDLAALQTADKVDIEGLLLKINADMQMMDELPLREQVHSSKSVSSDVKVDSSEGAAWRQALRHTWETLKNVVIVHSYQHSMTAVLPPTDKAFLRQNLKFFLMQAQWGVLHGKQALYQSSLAQAQQWLSQYFPADNARVKQMQKTLSTLAASNVDPQLPGLVNSIQAIQEALDARTEKGSAA